MKKYIAEALGTFGIVFCGTGAIIINQEFQQAITHVGIAITFGFIVMAMIYSFSSISGAHFNPAVSIALFIFNKFPGKETLAYIASQILGAMLASLILKLMFPTNEGLGATLPAGNAWTSFALEIVLTYFLMLAIFQLGESETQVQQLGGFIIGGIVLLEAMFAGPVSGASMNPARSIAPALVSGQLNSLWVYLIACPLGAILAGLTHHFIRNKQN